MNLNLFLEGEEQKKRRRKELSINEKHKFYYCKEFIKFCLKQGVLDTKDVDGKIYANFVKYLKYDKKNKARTRLDKCYIVKSFLKNSDSPFKPNPWRSYAKNTGKH